MSHSGKPISDLGLGALTDRIRDSLSCDSNKPDFKELDLGSPVSPLRAHSAGAGGGPAASGLTTTTSSSSSSSGSVSGRNGPNPVSRRSENGGGNNHSGELSVSSESSPNRAESFRSGVTAGRNFKPGHRRSDSGGSLIYSGGGGGGGGGSSVSSPPLNVLPTGNICPSGRILKTGMANRTSARSDVLGSGTVNYGHGSIMRGGIAGKSGGIDSGSGNCRGTVGGGPLKRGAFDPEELKRAGNEQYKRGNFGEALSLYDRAIALSPNNAAYRSNRAAALTGLGRLLEAVRECEEAIKLDPGYGRVHQRLASLLVRLGQVDNAREHLYSTGQQPDSAELQKLQLVEKHLNKCSDARKVGDWRSALREADAAIAAGADGSPQLFTCRVEALLKLHQLDDADSSLSSIPKSEPHTQSCSQSRVFGMFSEAYLFFVRAQIEMALGRFDNAVAVAEKAAQLDARNIEISVLVNNVRLVARARARGNDLFKSERFTEACSAYGEGLRLSPLNSILYCNRAACWFKLGLWERSVEDCSHALRIQPTYTKALLRRAASNSKLERWVEAVRDYEVLRRELPEDKEVAESLFHAQVALRKSRGEDVSNMKFGGEVEEVLGLDQFRAAISSPGVSVVHFKAASSTQCGQISPFVDSLCGRYPSINFLKVDVEGCPAVASSENVRVVPTFKIYKNGARVKEMICPSHQVLEYSVRHYSF